MAPNDPRFVAHVDILGMSTLVEADAERAWNLLTALADVRDSISSLQVDFAPTGELLNAWETTQTVTFSDTIIYFTKGSSLSELRALIVLMVEVLHQAMCRCVPVRIGIALGQFFVNFDRSMYAGPALVEAYRVGESSQWIGISLAKSVASLASSIGLTRSYSGIVGEWPVPIRDGSDLRQVIKWPVPKAHTLKVPPPLTVGQFYQSFEANFGPFESLAPDAQVKYVNTVAFLNACLSSSEQA